MEIATLRKKLIAACGLTVEPKTVKAGNINTFYLSAGEGEPLVLLHGAGGGAVLWGPVINLLSKHFHVIAPDIVGYGESDKPDAPYDKNFFSTWFCRFCDSLNMEKINLLGNSQGGAISIRFAYENPARVNKLILVGSAGLARWGISPAAVFNMVAANIFPTRRTVQKIVKYLVYKTDYFPYHEGIDYLVEVIRSSGGKFPFLNGKGRTVAPFSSAELRQITNPTLIIWGAKDRILPLSHGKKGYEKLPDAQLRIIHDAGHTPFIDAPEEFNSIVLHFITTRYQAGKKD
ncbi:MAG: alpha/beta fold hydrolase [Thermodesulfobacteriota bacterium]|nr:alpha/beta fold hydrolase [Thermodesulfobacteriota bacterium]